MKKRKVFISFLGTGNYSEAVYEFAGERPDPTRFVQEALVWHLCGDWSAEDQVIVFCTEGAHSKNWIDGGQVDRRNGKPLQGLKTTLQKLKETENLQVNIQETISIPEGFNETQVWEIFNKVYEVLEEGDEIYFDMTHSFRAIPLFATVLFNFAKVMKRTTLRGVYYGAFEALGPAYKLDENYPNPIDRVRPIVDLSQVVALQQYTAVAHELEKYGRIKGLNELLRDTKKRPELASLNNLNSKLTKFEKYLQTNNLKDLANGNNYLEQHKLVKKNSKKADLPIQLILDHLWSNLEQCGFSLDDTSGNQNIEATIRWVDNHDMLLQAYTLGQEYLISRLVDIYGEMIPNFQERKIKDEEVRRRQYISAICAMDQSDVEKENFRGALGSNLQATKAILSDRYMGKIRLYFNQITQYRNEINHAKGDRTFEAIKNNFQANFYPCLEVINSIEGKRVAPAREERPKLLINLSNHPTGDWTPKQKRAAKEYGEVQDLPFPNVSPSLSSEELNHLVEKCFQNLLALSERADITVHLMGEFTFTHRLINRLQGVDIKCLASTTERIVTEVEGQQKLVTFQFVGFRPY